MNATIKIITTDGILEIESPINFSPIELPYGGIGFEVNGTSVASESDLQAYWSFIASTLQNNNLATRDYISLKSIEYDNTFYGIIN
jgi:hypothetical protein